MTIDLFLNDHRFWLLAVCLAGFLVFMRQSPSIHAVLGFFAYSLSVAMFNMWTTVPYPESFENWEQAVDVWGRQWEWWAVGLNGMLTIYLFFLCVFAMWRPIHKSDILAKMVWSVLLIAEIWSYAFENYVCNIHFSTPSSEVIKGMLGEGDSIYACGRIFGEAAVWIPTSVQIAVLLWLVWLHARARDRMPSL